MPSWHGIMEFLNVMLGNNIPVGLFLMPKSCFVPDEWYKQIANQCNTIHVQWATYLGNKQAMADAEHVMHRRRLVYSKQHMHRHCPAEIQLTECTEVA